MQVGVVRIAFRILVGRETPVEDKDDCGQADLLRAFADSAKFFEVVVVDIPAGDVLVGAPLPVLRAPLVADSFEVLKTSHNLPATHLAIGEMLLAEGRHAEALDNHLRTVLNSHTSAYLKERSALAMASAATHIAKAFAKEGDPTRAAALLRKVATFLESKRQTKSIPRLEEIADVYSSGPSRATPPPAAQPPEPQ